MNAPGTVNNRDNQGPLFVKFHDNAGFRMQAEFLNFLHK